MTGAEKRAFIMALAYPNGEEACQTLGFPPASADVLELEQIDAKDSLEQLMLFGFHRLLLDRANWFIEHVGASQVPMITSVDLVRFVLVSLADLIRMEKVVLS